MRFRIPDWKLALPERWFRGIDWTNGTATEQFKQDYRDAIRQYWKKIDDKREKPLKFPA